MHSYRKADGAGWQAGYQHPDEPRFSPLGPVVDFEWEAAAIACFLNGGRYCPEEIAMIFARPLPHHLDDDDSTYPRPEGMDYAPEAARK